jgi:hypothetical protein
VQVVSEGILKAKAGRTLMLNFCLGSSAAAVELEVDAEASSCCRVISVISKSNWCSFSARDSSQLIEQ